jgi:carboxylesterase
MKYIDLLAKFQPYMPKSNEPPGSGWFDQEALKDHVSYPQNPVRSIGQLNRLMAEMRAALPQIKVPVQLIHSKDDPSVAPMSMPAIFELLTVADKSMAWVEGSGHVLTRDAKRQQVFQIAAEFIQRQCKSQKENQ